MNKHCYIDKFYFYEFTNPLSNKLNVKTDDWHRSITQFYYMTMRNLKFSLNERKGNERE